MIPGRIERATRHLGAPPGWEPDTAGHCAHLAIRDEQFGSPTGPWGMVSAWEPTPDELARINAGAPIFLTVIGGVHPPVGLSVGFPPKEEPKP